MQKQNPTGIASESPFFELLAEAEEIKIREVRPETGGQKLPSTVERSLQEWNGTGDPGHPGHRTFFVHIKTKPEPSASPASTSSGTVAGKTAPAHRTYLLRSAELLVADADYVLARNIYSYLLKSNLRDEEAMKGLGVCFHRLGETTSAKKCFRALHEISGREECLVWLGQCFAAEGDDNQATQYFQWVTKPAELPPDEQFDLHRELGNCLTRQGRLDEAWSAYHKALELKPSSDTIYVNLGTLEIQRNHGDVASSCFNKAVQINPRNSRARCGLGLVAVSKQEYATAEKEFVAALDLDAQNQIALLQLVNLTDKTFAFATARQRLEQYLAKEPKSAEIRFALAVTLFKESDWARCAREVEAILAQIPGHAKAKALKEELSRNRPIPA